MWHEVPRQGPKRSFVLATAVLVLFAFLGSPMHARATTTAAYGNLASGSGNELTDYECTSLGGIHNTDPSPSKHMITVFNNCTNNYYVAAQLFEYDQSGIIVSSCNQSGGEAINQYHCSLQKSQPSGYYWGWDAYMDATGSGTVYGYSCTDLNCFNSVD